LRGIGKIQPTFQQRSLSLCWIKFKLHDYCTPNKSDQRALLLCKVK
jgi:hypothetical protein